MEPMKHKDSNSSSSNVVVAAAAAVQFVQHPNICNSDSYSIIPSANSIELNAAASLSDDSGVPLTTNSSISSGDSYRLGMCKFEIELVESDGEVSQFDSLDNCSEGGMSAENFNTLKKGPLAPIDPPPEFQDSPKTTLVRSKNIVNNLRRWTSSQSSFEHLKERSNSDVPDLSVATATSDVTTTDSIDGSHNNEGLGMYVGADDERTLKDSYAISKHLYSSDSILNSHTDNIYDEPNNMISSSLGNSIDIIESDASSPVPPPPPPVSLVKIKQTLCPYYQDHTRYFKAIPSEQDHLTAAAMQRFNAVGLSEIHDYDLYYGVKRSTYQQQQYENSLQRKLLYSPLNHAHYCHNHHYHAGMNLYGNRPNSRNSLNSRLSSSHNSLRVSSANKPDDSIFITQAMSHDALLTREISDFYNVPIDSDIYAFPVDMIETTKECTHNKPPYNAAELLNKELLRPSMSDDADEQPPYNCGGKPSRRTKRSKGKSRNSGMEDKCSGTAGAMHGKQRHNGGAISATNPTRGAHRYKCTATSDQSASSAAYGRQWSQEPLHMTLDEVKQFYHTLYSADIVSTAANNHSCAGSTAALQRVAANTNKSSNETIWSTSSTRSTRLPPSLGCSREKGCGTNAKFKADAINNNNNNNNNNNHNHNNNNSIVNIINSQNSHNQQMSLVAMHAKVAGVATDSVFQQAQQQQLTQQQQGQQQTSPTQSGGSGSNTIIVGGKQISLTTGNNITTITSPPSTATSTTASSNEKKSQFTLSLKQKFCSIFRFRRSHNRCRSAHGNVDGNGSGGDRERERKKFQSRALPPLPKKAAADNNTETECKTHQQQQQQQILEVHRRSEPRAQFTSSIEKVKDYGWYWGPLSSEAAEKVLSNEPDGSFIVRDSSDDHYIFSLSFKLNNCVRHVRIEQDQGTFSFGSYAKFKSQTITEFIEKAVEHSRSGRYLFFLHRRPEHGPMRVQLTNPVSRFKHVQSLQHMCRFIILKAVIRKDLIQTLPLPRRLLDYLSYKHCYSEQVESDSSHSQISGEGSL